MRELRAQRRPLTHHIRPPPTGARRLRRRLLPGSRLLHPLLGLVQRRRRRSKAARTRLHRWSEICTFTASSHRHRHLMLPRLSATRLRWRQEAALRKPGTLVSLRRRLAVALLPRLLLRSPLRWAPKEPFLMMTRLALSAMLPARRLRFRPRPRCRLQRRRWPACTLTYLT